MIHSRLRSILAVSALIVVLLLPLAAHASQQDAPQAVAMAGVSPDVVTWFSDGGIVVAWDAPKQVSKKDVVQYQVWRDSVPGMPGATPVGAVDFIAMPFSCAAGAWDHSWMDQPFGGEFEYYVLGSKGELVPMAATAAGVTPGGAHQYWITCVYRVNNSNASKLNYKVAGPIYAGQATMLSRPVPETPGGVVTRDYVDLSNATFRWHGVAGADEYVIEVSQSYNFERDLTWTTTLYRPTAQDGPLYTETFTNVLKNSDTGVVVPELADVPAGGTLFWRVGARNSADAPGPIPAGPSPAADGEKSTRYIYSDPSLTYSFMTLPDMPGPPPDDGDDPPPPPPL